MHADFLQEHHIVFTYTLSRIYNKIATLPTKVPKHTSDTDSDNGPKCHSQSTTSKADNQSASPGSAKNSTSPIP